MNTKAAETATAPEPETSIIAELKSALLSAIIFTSPSISASEVVMLALVTKPPELAGSRSLYLLNIDSVSVSLELLEEFVLSKAATSDQAERFNEIPPATAPAPEPATPKEIEVTIVSFSALTVKSFAASMLVLITSAVTVLPAKERTTEPPTAAAPEPAIDTARLSISVLAIALTSNEPLAFVVLIVESSIKA